MQTPATSRRTLRQLIPALLLPVLLLAAAPSVATSVAVVASVTATRASSVPTPPQPPLRVVLLDAQDLARPFMQTYGAQLRQALAEANDGRVALFLESPDLARFPRAAHLQDYTDWLRRKYDGRPIDLIVASSNLPAELVLAWRRDVFGNAPVVFAAVTPEQAQALPDAPGIAAVLWRIDVRGTMELARRLFPDTRRVALIGGSTYGDAPGEWMRRELRKLPDLEVIDPAPRSLHDMPAFVGTLPDNAVVLYSGVYSDKRGAGYLPAEALATLAPSSRRPIFGLSPSYLGLGVVGGSMIDIGVYARATAAQGMALVRGERPPMLEPAGANTLLVDYRQLQRWGADSALVPASALRFQQPTLWETHRTAVLVSLAVGLVLSLAVATLLWERRRRLHAERGLRRLSGTLLTAQESERQRIARDLHDDVNQRLALVALGLDALAGTGAAGASAGRLAEDVRQLSSDVHGLAQRLRPPLLDAGGLPVALQALATRFRADAGFEVGVDCAGWPAQSDANVQITLYRVAQEALQNAFKHSGTLGAQLRLQVDAKGARLTVSDDGRGIARGNDSAAELGLISMRERLALLGGSLQIDSAEDGGTRLVALVPLPVRTTAEAGGMGLAHPAG